MKQQIRHFVVMLALLLSVLAANAQTQTTHEVQRGETLEIIAQKYGVTSEALLQANPDAADMFFVGMKLHIPVATSTQPTVTSHSDVNTQRDVPTTNIGTTPSTTSSDKLAMTTNPQSSKSGAQTPEDFDFAGVAYGAAFEDASHGSYFGGFQRLSSSGWGLAFQMGANYGIVNSDYAGLSFYLGPAYGYVVSKNILLTASFAFTGTYCGTGEEVKEKQNAIGETIHYKGNDMKFGWGLALTPKVVFKASKILPFAGLDFGWTKDSKKIAVGFMVGLGFSI